MGGTGRYGGKGSKGKQVNTSTKGGVRPGAALALPNHYTVDILRPYHSEDGSVFVKRAGASRDGDLLSPEGLAQRVNATNSELLNRPGKGVTMLAGTLFHGLSAIQFAADHPGKNGLNQVEVPEEVLLAAKRLQEAQHTVTSAEQIQAAVLSVLEYLSDPDSVDTWRRTTILGAHLYVTGQQVLQVPGTRLFLSKWIQMHHEKYCSSGRTISDPRPKDWKLLTFRLSSLSL